MRLKGDKQTSFTAANLAHKQRSLSFQWDKNPRHISTESYIRLPRMVSSVRKFDRDVLNAIECLPCLQGKDARTQNPPFSPHKKSPSGTYSHQCIWSRRKKLG